MQRKKGGGREKNPHLRPLPAVAAASAAARAVAAAVGERPSCC